MGYAFISYSSKNQASADAIRKLLSKNNIDTWMAPYDIPAGSSYMGEINRALSGCSCLVLLLSEASQSSQWVLKELNKAISYNKTIIPVKIENIILNDDFDFALESCHIVAIQKVDESSEEVKNILKSVIACTGVNAADSIRRAEVEKPKKEAAAEKPVAEVKKQNVHQRPVTKPESPRVKRDYEAKTKAAEEPAKAPSNETQSVDKIFAVFQELKKLPSDAFYPHDLLLREKLTEQKKKRFRSAMKHISENPDLNFPVAVIDTTILQNGKRGFIFNGEEMYCYKNKTRFSVKFADIEQATADDVYLYIKYTNGTSDKYPVYEKRIAELLNNISAAVKKQPDRNDETNSTPESQSAHEDQNAPEAKQPEPQKADAKKIITDEANFIKVPEGIFIKGNIMTISSMKYVPDTWKHPEEWEAVTTLVLGEEFTEIKMEAFRYMKNLRNVILPKGLKKIGYGAFSNCPELDNVIIPEGTTTISANAFNRCNKLSHIYIPDSVLYIGNGAFDGCRLQNVVVNKNCAVCPFNPGIIKATD